MGKIFIKIVSRETFSKRNRRGRVCRPVYMNCDDYSGRANPAPTKINHLTECVAITMHSVLFYKNNAYTAQLTLFRYNCIMYNIYEVMTMELFGLIGELAILFVAFHFLFKDYKDAQRGDKVKGFFRGFLIFFILLVLMDILLDGISIG